MKNVCLMLCFLVATAVKAQYVVDYTTTPLNPLPQNLKYNTSHFNLKGNVKKLTVIKGFSDDSEYFFD